MFYPPDSEDCVYHSCSEVSQGQKPAEPNIGRHLGSRAFPSYMTSSPVLHFDSHYQTIPPNVHFVYLYFFILNIGCTLYHWCYFQNFTVKLLLIRCIVVNNSLCQCLLSPNSSCLITDFCFLLLISVIQHLIHILFTDNNNSSQQGKIC